MSDSIYIKTPEFRVAFPEVFKAVDKFDSGKLKFSITMLFPNGTDLSALKKLAHDAVNRRWPDKAKRPKLRSPFRDGNEKDWDGYADTTFVKATTKQKPGIIDKAGNVLTTSEEFYGGCWAIAKVEAFAYSTAGNTGVSFQLGSILKLRDDDSFGGGARDPKNDFEDDIDETAFDTAEANVEKASMDDMFSEDTEGDAPF